MAVWRVSILCAWESDDVQVMQENPKDFFGHVGDFLAPDSVGARATHVEDETDWPLGLAWFGVSKVG